MITLSLCMIVKNEEKNISNCLSCVRGLFDEIIIVDTGSTDNTKEIVKNYTDKIYDFKWCDDFSKARNFSFSKATSEYIMWLDADDIILKNDFDELKMLKESLDNTTDMVMLKYNLNVDEYGNPALSYYRERIVKANMNYSWISPIHEVIVPRGNVIYKDIAITHNKTVASDPERNLRIFEKMIKSKKTLDARQMFYYARELYYNKNYSKSIKYFKEFLNMDSAWKENKISACIDLHNIYVIKKQTSKALTTLFKTFEYDTPRAEVCCHIGSILLSKGYLDMAIFWYNQALNKEYDLTSGGFYNKDYFDFIPYLQLCVCHYRLGDINLSKEYNEKAGKIKPKDNIYLKNVAFFNSIN